MAAQLDFIPAPRQMTFWELGDEKYSKTLNEVHLIGEKVKNLRKSIFPKIKLVEDKCDLIAKNQEETNRILMNQCLKLRDLKHEVEQLKEELRMIKCQT